MAVTTREERSYIEEERGYIPGRARLYFCYENSGHLPFLPAAKGSARTPLGPKLKEMVDYGVLEEYWQQHSNN